MNEVQSQKVGRFARARALTSSAWHVLKLNKEFVGIPLIQLLITIILLAACFGAVFLIVHTSVVDGVTTQSGRWEMYGALVIFTVLSYIINNFFVGALIYGSIQRFNGEDPTIRSSFGGAAKNLKSIVQFSLLSSTIGLVLSKLSEYVPWFGKILTWLGGVAWNIASFFSIPFIVMSERPIGPVKATKKSTELVRRVWGESLVVGASIGAITLLSFLVYSSITIMPSVILLTVNQGLGIIALSISITGLFLLGSVFAALSAIVKAAIFYWATTGKAPETFNKELLRNALTPKKARKIFA